MPDRVRLARFLVRLYPRAWRDRYADELLALVDETGVTWRRLIDLAMAVGSEWLRQASERIGRSRTGRSFVRGVLAYAVLTGGGCAIATVGFVIARVVLSRFGTMAAFQPVHLLNGFVEAPPFSMSFELVPIVVGISAILRACPAIGTSEFAREIKVGSVELAGWCVVLLAASTVDQRCALPRLAVPGFWLSTPRACWNHSAIATVVNVQLLLLSSLWLYGRGERLRALGSEKPMPPRDVLGLGPTAL